MASKVNTKFILLLSAGLIGMVGLVGTALFVFGKNSAGDLIAKADAEAAKGDYRMAAEYASRAVNKEQTNVDFINKWRDALAKYAPEDITRFSESYRNYILATRQIATVQSTNVESQRDYLNILRTEIENDEVSRPTLDYMIRETETMLRYHESEPKDGKWNVLRRFRGLASVRIMAMSPDVKPELITQAKEDLEAALAADRTDTESAIALEAWYEIQRSRLDPVTRSADIAEMGANAQAVIDAALAANPSDPAVLMANLRREFSQVESRLRASGITHPLLAQAQIALAREAGKPTLDVTAAALKAAPAKISLPLVTRFRALEQIVDPQSRYARTEDVLRTAIEAQPERSDLLLVQADVFAERLAYSEAIANAQRILDTKPLPISLEGYQLFGRKKRAVFLQSLWSVKNWEVLTEPTEKAEALAYSRSRFEQLKKIEDPEAPELALMNAYLAFVDEKFIDANRAIDQYNTKTNNGNPDALWLKAVISEKVREPGASKRALEDLLRIRPNDLRGIIALGRLEASLGNTDRAAQLAQSVLKIVPDFQPAIDLVEMTSGTSTDPVTNAVREIDALDKTLAAELDPQRDDKVLALIETKAAEYPTDVRIAQIRAIQNLRMNRRDEARRVIEAALVTNPDSPVLKNVLISINNPDPVEAAKAMIMADIRASDVDRAISLFTLYQGAGRKEEAAVELNKAIQAAPDDPRVVELQFMRALDIGDLSTAQVVCDRAVASNLDKVGGASFRARLFAARGQHSEAIATLEQAMAKGGASPEMWRLLGRIQNAAGKTTDGIRSFREALNLRPNDIPTINDYVQSLVMSGRGVDGLAATKEFERYAGGDPTFLEQSLLLEARFGDKATAIERRRRIAKSSPDNRRNSLELASLLIDTKLFDEAKSLITAARSVREGIDVAALDAQWFWTQGRRDDAKAVYEAILDKPLPEETSVVLPYLAYAAFLNERGFVDDSAAVLERARAKQDPKVLEADRSLSDLYFQDGAFDKAGESARRVVDAGIDASGTYRKRLAESLIREKKFLEAEAELNKLSNSGEPDMIAMLLMADAKSGLGDDRAARTLLDSAVARFQTEPTVFIKRGQQLLVDSTRARDALADFTAALRLKPDSWQALRLRAAAYVALNDVNSALADLRGAVKLAPENDELVLGLVNDLIRMKKVEEASAIAQEVTKARSTDFSIMATLGDLFGRFEHWPVASRLFAQAFALDTQDAIAQRYLESLLNSNPPEIARAETVLTTLETRVGSTPGFLMAYARVRNGQSRFAEADRFAIEAVKLLKSDNPGLMIAWFNDAQKIQSDPIKLVKFLDSVAAAGVGGDWMSFFKAGVLTSDPSKMEDGLTILRGLIANTKIDAVRQLAYRQLGNSLFGSGKNEEAAKAWSDSLAAFPNDFESANNLAYVYLKFLNRPADALPLAEKAAAAISNSAEVLDTLGLAQSATGKTDDAITTFRRAWLLANTDQAKATVGLHLLRVLDGAQKPTDAKDLVRLLDDLFARSAAEIAPDLKTEFEELRSAVMKK